MHGNYRRNFLFGGVGSSGKQSAAAAGTMPKVTSSPAGVLAPPHPNELKTNEAVVGQKTSSVAQQQQQQQQQQQHQQHQPQHLSAPAASSSPINNTSGRTYANHFGHLSPAQQQLYAQQQQQFCSNAQQRSSPSSAHKMLGNCAMDEQQLHGCNNYTANNNNSHGQDDCSQLDADQYANQLRNLSIQSSKSNSGRGQSNQQHHHHQQQQPQQQHYYGGLMPSNNQQQRWIHSKPPQQPHPKDQKHYPTMTIKSQDQTDQTSNGNSNNNHRHQSASSSNTTPAQSSSSLSSSSLRVNFNRANRLDDDDNEQPGESRKKKYLTAKYGQQQMNLIKKRLKIETWLHEQLQELAKSINAEAELDEIDIDLDQLLDMEDDETRQHWLKQTLEPFERLPSDKLEKFIGQVLEQSKLL